jgi:hypothetical protein
LAHLEKKGSIQITGAMCDLAMDYIGLLREGWQWHDSQGAIPSTRFDLDRWDENTVAAMDGSDESDGGTACCLST